MSKFDLGNGYVASCRYANGIYCFYHFCTLYKDGKRISKARAEYINRTWERYRYQTAIKAAIRNCKSLSQEEKDTLLIVTEREPQTI